MDNLEDYERLQENLVKAINLQADKAPNTLELKWRNKAAVARANQLYQLLGTPRRFDKEVGGVAVWTYVDPYLRRANVFPIDTKRKPINVYSKLVIKDEEIPHIVPVPHTDWFYASIYLDVPSDKVEDVLALTESISYDTMTRECTSRCHFLSPDLVTLYLAKQIARGDKNLLHAQQEYVVLIPTLAKEGMLGGLLKSGTFGPWHKALTDYTF